MKKDLIIILFSIFIVQCGDGCGFDAHREYEDPQVTCSYEVIDLDISDLDDGIVTATTDAEDAHDYGRNCTYIVANLDGDQLSLSVNFLSLMAGLEEDELFEMEEGLTVRDGDYPFIDSFNIYSDGATIQEGEIIEKSTTKISSGYIIQATVQDESTGEEKLIVLEIGEIEKELDEDQVGYCESA